MNVLSRVSVYSHQMWLHNRLDYEAFMTTGQTLASVSPVERSAREVDECIVKGEFVGLFQR